MPRFGFPDRSPRSTTRAVKEITKEEMKALFVKTGLSPEQAEMQTSICQTMGSNVLIDNICYKLK